MSAPEPTSQSLTFRLFLLVAISIGPAFVLALYSGLEQRQIARERVREDATQVALLDAANLEILIENARLLLTFIAEAPQLRHGNAEASHALLKGLLRLHPSYENFSFAPTNGMVVADAFTLAGSGDGTDVSTRNVFTNVIKAEKFVVGGLSRLAGTNSAVVDFGVPVRHVDGRLVGVLIGAHRLAPFTEIAAKAQLPEGGSLTVMDRQGNVLVRHPKGGRWAETSVAGSPLLEVIVGKQQGIVEMPGFDGVRRLFAFAPIKGGIAPALFVSVGIPLEIAYAGADRVMFRNLLLLMLVALTACLIGRVYAGRRIIQPVSALVSAARRVQAGDLKARSGLRRERGELGQLAVVFDEMAESLEKRQAETERSAREIKRLNEELEARVTERTGQLQAVNKELEAFSYSVSHDLRAPLRHIDGFARMLQKNGADRLDATGQRHLSVISEAARKMGNLIDDLLTLSRVGRTAMTIGEVNLGGLARSVIAEFEPDIGSRDVEWIVRELPTVHGDSKLLRLVFVNLISNALKYSRTRKRSRIEVGAETANGANHVIFVRDNGVGFDPEYGHKLFGVFQRLHSDRDFEGTGIGLANVRRIITRHGGETWAEGKLDEGAAFYFSIPAARHKGEGNGATKTPTPEE